jgi:hypothetical protein
MRLILRLMPLEEKLKLWMHCQPAWVKEQMAYEIIPDWKAAVERCREAKLHPPTPPVVEEEEQSSDPPPRPRPKKLTTRLTKEQRERYSDATWNKDVNRQLDKEWAAAHRGYGHKKPRT